MSNNAKGIALVKGCINMLGLVCLLTISVNVQAQTAPNLDITKSSNINFAIPGQSLNWVVTITKVSNTPSIGYIINDILPSGYELNLAASSFPPGSVNFNPSSNQFMFTGSHNGGQNTTQTFTFIGQVSSQQQAPSAMVNTAVMSYNIPGLTLPNEQGQAIVQILNPSISGFKFNDLNGNGIFDGGEPKLPGWVIYIDANDNGVLDPGETQTVTDGAGNYNFIGVPFGIHIIREVIQPGWVQTFPGAGALFKHEIEITPNEFDKTANFGNRQLPSIKVIKWNDVDNSGTINAGDTRLPGWTFYIDQNLNGQFDPGEPTEVTDGSGEAVFENLAAGNYRIREILQPDWEIVIPAIGFINVVLLPNDLEKTVEFLNVYPNTVDGVKFHDLNANGSKDPGEPLLQGWQIYVDLNSNGQYDPGEPTDITDVNGFYSIFPVPFGIWDVLEIQQPGWVQTAPLSSNTAVGFDATGATESLDFGNTQPIVLGGVKFFDRNGNGIRDDDEQFLEGWTIYVDANNNSTLDAGEAFEVTDGIGYYQFNQFLAGTYVLREVMQDGWVQTAPLLGFHSVTFSSGESDLSIDFGNRLIDGSDPFAAEDIVGNIWYDEVDLRRWDLPLEQPLQGIEVELTGKTDDGADVSRVTVTDEDGIYRFEDLEFGTYTVRRVESLTRMAEYPNLENESPNGHGHRIILSEGYDGIERPAAAIIAGDSPGWLSEIVTPASGGVYLGMFIDLDLNDDGVADSRLFASGTIAFSWQLLQTSSGLSLVYNDMHLHGYSEQFGDFVVTLRPVGNNIGTVTPTANTRIANLTMNLLLNIEINDENWQASENNEVEFSGESFRWLPYGSLLKSAPNTDKQLFNVFGQSRARIVGAEAQMIYAADFSLNRSRFSHAPEDQYATGIESNGARAVNPFDNDANPIFRGTDFEQRYKVRNFLTPEAPEVDFIESDPAVIVPSPLRSGRVVTIRVETEGVGRLLAWIDTDNNGEWSKEEMVINDANLFDGGERVQFFTMTVPDVVEPGLKWMRMRLYPTDAETISPDGIAFGGDIRDMPIEIVNTGSSIRGIAFSDNNLNGLVDDGDAILDNLQLYVDLNLNDQRDENEPVTTTSDTGFFELNLPGAGTYQIIAGYPNEPGFVFSQPDPISVGENEDLERNLNLGYVIVSDSEDKPDVPTGHELAQNYPNPFNPTTVIGYTLAERAKVKLSIHDMTGREVRTMVNSEQQAGSYSVTFDAGLLPSGVYLYRITIGSQMLTRKMVLLK
jgi:hypothetical protein